jgi:hypothetical protein
MRGQGSAHAVGLHRGLLNHGIAVLLAMALVQGRFDYDMELVNGSIVLLGGPSVAIDCRPSRSESSTGCPFKLIHRIKGW